MSKPTPATEYDNALDKADFYRRKWLEIEAQRDDLLAALESIVSLDLCCATLEEKRKADAVFAAARAAITQATGGAK